MKLTRICLLLLAMWCISVATQAQEQIGLRIENFSGINSVLLNPANNLTSHFKWDVNLVAAGVFAENNYAYIKTTNLIQLSKASDFVYAGDENEIQTNEDPLVYDYFDRKKDHFLTIATNVMGPSFMINLESGHSFGLITNFRSYVSSQNIPANLNYHWLVDNAAVGFSFQLAPFDAAGMVWSEFGLNYGMTLETATGNIGFGATAKFLQGYEAFYFKSTGSNFTVTDRSANRFDFENTEVAFGFTNNNSDGEDINLQKNGTGFSFDLGAIMTIGGAEDLPYKWKFGASILDIGSITFNSNAETHVINTNNIISLDANNYNNADDLDELTQQLSQDVFGDPSTSKEGETFKVWLPGALSLQADYAVNSNIYINALAIQRVSLGDIAVKRGNLLAITPRFESRWIGLSIPVVLYNWQQINVGTALRLAFLTIGSDNVGSILGSSSFTGTDFYISLKVNPFKMGLNFGGKASGGKKGKRIKCYEF